MRAPSGWRSTSWCPFNPSTRTSSVLYGRHAWWTNTMKDSATTMTMPWRTPTRATPRKAASDNAVSVPLIRARRSTTTSTSEVAATITTAARVADGR